MINKYIFDQVNLYFAYLHKRFDLLKLYIVTSLKIELKKKVLLQDPEKTPLHY